MRSTVSSQEGGRLPLSLACFFRSFSSLYPLMYLSVWGGGWVGGWGEIEAVRMSYCTLCLDRWVGGWVGG